MRLREMNPYRKAAPKPEKLPKFKPPKFPHRKETPIYCPECFRYNSRISSVFQDSIKMEYRCSDCYYKLTYAQYHSYTVKK